MRYFGRKLVQLVLILFAVTFLSFWMLNLLPGDPAVVICGFGCDEEGIEQVREELGLNDPIPVRYVEWLSAALTGDLGESAISKQPVWEAIQERMPVTIELLIYSQVLALGIAIPCAIIASQRPDGIFDKTSSGIAFLFFAIPNFVLALVLVLVFAVNLGWFPATNYVKLTSDMPTSIYENLKSLFLPAVTLAAAETAVYLRLLRTDMIATLQEDYITMAKAKGMPNRRILMRHAFRPVDLLARHRGRPQHGPAHRRHAHHRGDLRPQRAGQLPRRRHLPPRLHRGAGGGGGDRRGLRAHQLHRRHAVRRHRPQGAPCQSNRLTRSPGPTADSPEFFQSYGTASAIIDGADARVREADTFAILDPEDAALETEQRKEKVLGFGFWLAAGWLVVLVLACLIAPFITVDDPSAIVEILPDPIAGVSSDRVNNQPDQPIGSFDTGHPLGTDGLGRDLLSRVIWGGRISLRVGFTAIAFGLAVGGLHRPRRRLLPGQARDGAHGHDGRAARLPRADPGARHRDLHRPADGARHLARHRHRGHPAARPTGARQHARLLPTRVRDGSPHARGQELPHHLAGDRPQRLPGGVQLRGDRHRGGHRGRRRPGLRRACRSRCPRRPGAR